MGQRFYCIMVLTGNPTIEIPIRNWQVASLDRHIPRFATISSLESARRNFGLTYFVAEHSNVILYTNGGG